MYSKLHYCTFYLGIQKIKREGAIFNGIIGKLDKIASIISQGAAEGPRKVSM